MAQTVVVAQIPTDSPGPDGISPMVEATAPGNGMFTPDALPYTAPIRQAKGDLGFDTLPPSQPLTHAGLPFDLGPTGGVTRR